MNALALIIGNDNYILDKSKLYNAVNNANAIADAFLKLGYNVQKLINCDKNVLALEISKYLIELEKYDIGLLYFSGHALQIDGENYLSPIDADFSDEKIAKYTSVSLKDILEDMHRANVNVKIAIFDVYMNALFPKICWEKLNPWSNSSNSVIAFSTSPVGIAMDGNGSNQSIYTQSLLKYIQDEDIPIKDIFEEVKTSVHILSEGKQSNWEYIYLTEDYSCNFAQLIKVVNMPYSENVIADSKYVYDESDVSEIIKDLRSRNWFAQREAFSTFRTLGLNDILDINTQFLIGRNILQVAEGDETSTRRYMWNLYSGSVQSWSIGNENHVLNGILYEIYFDSKGAFRKEMKFKSTYITSICMLEEDIRFKSSFNFISKQLQSFRNELSYIPSSRPVNVAVELIFKKENTSNVTNDTDIVDLILEAININGKKMLNFSTYTNYAVPSESIKRALSYIFAIPLNRLTISTNYDDDFSKSNTRIRLSEHF